MSLAAEDVVELIHLWSTAKCANLRATYENQLKRVARNIIASSVISQLSGC
jgi:hypothetical protein